MTLGTVLLACSAIKIDLSPKLLTKKGNYDVTNSMTSQKSHDIFTSNQFTRNI